MRFKLPARKKVYAILTGVLLVWMLGWLCQRWVCQYSRAAVLVSTMRPMPEEYRSKFTTRRIPSTMDQSVPYDAAIQKKVTPEDIRKIRKLLAWDGSQPYRPDVLDVRSAALVIAIGQKDKQQQFWITLQKSDGDWKITAESWDLVERAHSSPSEVFLQFIGKVLR